MSILAITSLLFLTIGFFLVYYSNKFLREYYFAHCLPIGLGLILLSGAGTVFQVFNG